MKTGKVIALHCGGSGNKIFRSGDKVTEKNFPAGNFDKLVAGGFIKEDEAPAEESKPPVVTDPKDEDLGTSKTGTEESKEPPSDEKENGEGKAPSETEKDSSKKNHKGKKN